ncbi:MAG: cell division protein FtsZ [Candidatus Kapabacteria bacterium]|nr:cell division protein FtsZ [Candidatus Kapabacteria bacterium]
MIGLDKSNHKDAKITVIGVGGGGGNAIHTMIKNNLQGVTFVAANTDNQALTNNPAPIKVQLGKNGLGAGADPKVGKEAVEDNIEEIKEVIRGSDMVFITAGMGGGTGTGGAPVIAKIAQEMGALVVAVVTKPFEWEGKKRAKIAEEGIKDLKQYVDALITIPNQKLLGIIEKKTTFGEAFEKVDEVLLNAVRGISDIISKHGKVNVDFADVKTVMKGMGDALMGIGIARGEHRAVEATQNALNSPLLDGISIKGAAGVLVNVTGGSDMGFLEVVEAVKMVEESTGSDVNLIHGVVYGDEPSEEMMVTVVATGFNKDFKNGSTLTIDQNGLRGFSPISSNKSNKTEVSNGIGNPFRPSHHFGLEPEISETEQRTEPKQKPSTPKELKELEIPAYERRNGMKDGLLNLSTNFSSVDTEIAANNDFSEHSRNVIEAIEKPAFLRKILD